MIRLRSNSLIQGYGLHIEIIKDWGDTMVYVTVKQSPRFHQLSIEELLFGEDKGSFSINPGIVSTVTYEREILSDKILKTANISSLIALLRDFNAKNDGLRMVDRKTLYSTFYIPKKSGGVRKINAPNSELMSALRDLKFLFETRFNAMYHASAFAYVKGRSTVDCVKKHQANQSRWFAKLDLHNFFGSTTIDFVMEMIGMIFPFSEVVKDEGGRSELKKAIDLAFLEGGLPQGTPISPLITNVMMIPIDFRLSKKFSDFSGQRFVYTRYADDFIISSRYDFNIKDIESAVKDVLSEFQAPFTINDAKTRYGSSSGSNWNLGVMLNKDNSITVGAKNKKRFAAMISNYAKDKKSGIDWPLEDIQSMMGLFSYYRMVEGETIDGIILRESRRAGINIMSLIKSDLKG